MMKVKMDNTYIIAAEPLSKDWQAPTVQALESLKLQTTRNQHGIVAWGKVHRKLGVFYSDGYALGSLWLGHLRNALSITSKRLYFIDEGKTIDKRPEHEILGERKITSLPTADQVDLKWRLLAAIMPKIDARLHPVLVKKIPSNLGDARRIQIGSAVRPTSDSLKNIYRKYGFDTVPPRLIFSICPLEGVHSSVAQNVAVQLKTEFQKTQCPHVEAKISDTAKIKAFLENQKHIIPSGWCAFFILPSSNKQPTDQTLSLFSLLENAGVPFRRAFSNDPIQHSILEQIPSLLIAAGGIPHRSPTSITDQPIWTIGIDIGHAKANRYSTLALTLVNPDGLLSGAWTIDQPRDETVRSDYLQKLLKNCVSHLSQCDKNPSIVVIRDGRPFKNENLAIYSEILKARFTFIEYRKRNNPQIVNLFDKPVVVNEPFAAIVPGCNTMFLISQSGRDRFTPPRVTKIHWKERYNHLNLKPEDIARLITVSSTAPSLGCQPHIDPAAIYWADGIAGMDNIDTKFRGVKVKRL